MEGENELKSGDVDAIEVLMAVLDSGSSAELTASGYSMFPALRPGDRVTVSPVKNGELPAPGAIVVYRDGEDLIMHRLRKIQTRGREQYFTTRGDSRDDDDEDHPLKDMIGVAVSYRRRGREYRLRNFIVSRSHYKINRILLLMHFRVKNICRRLGGV